MSDNWRLRPTASGTQVRGSGNWSLGSLVALPFCRRRNPAAVASRRALGATALVVAGMWVTGMLPGRPAAASVVVHSFGAQNSTAAASLAASPTTATTAGDLLIATIRSRNVTAIAPVTGVTDSNGEHWLQAGTSAQHGSDADGEIWYMTSAAALSTSQSVTVTVGGSSAATSAIAFTVLDVSGMATVSPLDVTAPPTSGNTQPSKAGPTPTTTQNSDLVVGALGWNGNGTTTSATTTGYTVDPIHQSTVSGAAAAEQAAYQVLSTTGVQNYQATLSSSTAAWTGVMATFKVSTGPPPTPTITSFNPTHGVVGTSVTITGSGYTGTTGASGVQFNGINATTYSVSDDAHISATVPTAATTGPIKVTAPGGPVTSTTNFTVDSPPAPTITSFSPTSGTVGKPVTITGSGFTGTTGAGGVQFNGVNAAYSVTDDAHISTSVPTGASTGPIKVTAPGGPVISTSNFTVNVAAGPPHIMLIVEENQSYSEIDGVSSAPYINNTLRTAYPAAWATKWYGVQHNSPYDYVELLSGVKKTSLTGGGFTDPTLVDELHTAGIPWLAYMENLSAPCKNTGSDNVNLYDVNHNPFHYYKNYSSWCSTSGEGVLPYPGISGMLSTLNGSNPPAFVWVTPNDCNEMHGDTTNGAVCASYSNNQLISAGDTWLQNNIGQVLSSPWFAQNGTVIITWDEAAQSDGSGCCGLASPAGGHVATLVLSHNNNGTAVTANGDHYGTLATIARAYGVSVANLGNANNVANGDLSPAFGTLPTPGSITGTVKDSVTGALLSGATVSYSGGSTTTNGSGVYTLSNVAPGSYTVTASANNYVTQPASGVVVASGSPTTKPFLLVPNLGSITGTVTDSVLGQPIAGATVCVGLDATCATSTYTTTTNGSGVYTLTGVAESNPSYQMNLVATNYASQTVTGVVVTPGGTTTKNFAMIPNPGSITGTVTDSLSAPVIGATVCISTGGTCTGASTTTAAPNGTYALSSITEGSYQVTASDVGYSSQSATVNVTPGNPATTQNFTLTPGPGTISGTVADSVTTTGISGATVCISNGSNCTGPSTTTSSGGSYSLANVAPGTYTVTASATNYASQSIGSVVVTTGATTTENFTLMPNLGSITGTVTDSVLGQPIAGATVCVGLDATCATSTYTTTTNGSGVYTLTGVAESNPSYQMNLVATNYASQTVTGVVVTPGGTTTKNFAMIPNPGSITGTVTDSLSAPVIGATVCISTGGTCTGASTTTAAPNGTYALSSITEGSYQVTASDVGYSSQSATVNVTPGNPATTQNFTLTPGPGTISGTVADSVTTTGISGATVCISNGSNCTGPSTTTSSGGSYSLANVAPGTYTVTASATNYASQSIGSVVVTTGATTTENFTLMPNLGSITGTVTDSVLGQPIAGATVCVGLDATCATSTYTTTTNGSGVYTLTGVAESNPSYQMNLVATNYASQTVTGVVVTPGGTTTKNFAMIPNPGSITGTVTDSLSAPVIGATVCISNSGTCTATTTTTAPDGTYTLASIAEGSYQVTASAAGYSPLSANVTVTPGTQTNQDFALVAGHQPIFSDGFESNNFSAWTSTSTPNGLVTESTPGHVHSGTYAAEGATASGNAVKLLPSTYTTGYERVWFNVLTQSALVKVLQARTTGSGTTSNIAYVLVNATTHTLALNVNGTKQAGVGPAVSLASWHELEMQVTVNGASSSIQVWLDGVHATALDWTGTFTVTASNPIGQMQIGDPSAGSDVAFDDAAFDTQFLP